MEIPIILYSTLINIGVLMILNVRLWRRIFRAPSSLLVFFTFFFALLLGTMALIALSMWGLNDPILGQGAIVVAHFFLMQGLGFFAMLVFRLLFPGASRLLRIGIPIAINVVGIIIFVWQISDLDPLKTPVLFSIGEVVVTGYQSTSPLLSHLIQGVLSVLVFVVGGSLFLVHTRRSEGVVKKRAQSFGIAYSLGAVAVATNFLFGFLPGLGLFVVVASVSALVAILFIYRGVAAENISRK